GRPRGVPGTALRRVLGVAGTAHLGTRRIAEGGQRPSRLPAGGRRPVPGRLAGGRDPGGQAHQGHHGPGAVRGRAEAVPPALRGVGVTAESGTRVDRDAGLLEALRQGDPTAMEQLVDTYADRVYRLTFRITGSKEDAEEATQDALWTVGRKIA